MGYKFHQYIYSRSDFRKEILNANFSIIKELISESSVWLVIIAKK